MLPFSFLNMATHPQALIEELVGRNIITLDDLEVLKNEADTAGGDIGRIIVNKNIIDEASLRTLKSRIYKLPEIDILKVEIRKDLSREISEDVIKFYGIIPFAKEDDTLKVGVLNPEDIDALEALKFITEDRGLELEKYVISYKDFDKILEEYGSLKLEVGEALEKIEVTQKELNIPKEGSVEQITAETPITRIVGLAVKYAVESRASDIHIEPFEDNIRTRFRIDGVLQTALTLPKPLLPAIVTRIKILSELKIDETRLPQDGRFSTHLADRKIDFRVSILPTRNGEKVVMRILDPIVGRISLETLGFEGRNLELIKRNIQKPFGQILVTGPTGSGKSTTLYAVLRVLNDEGVNITTLEDPIEYFIDGINQSQVHEEIGFSFANGLRSILRQDPDIIMVGEIRDRETAALATQSALTGHIVLSTLHTNDAIGAIPRLIDMDVEKYLIAPTLNLAMGQRLLRKLCDDCKVESKPNAAEEKIINDSLNKFPEAVKKEIPKEKKFYKSSKEGCRQCGGKAFKGRIAIAEVLEMTDELEAIVLGALSEQAMRKEAFRQGMISMFQDGIVKVLKGVTSLDELLTVAQESESQIKEEKKEADDKNK